jgi:hypothetical protein
MAKAMVAAKKKDEKHRNLLDLPIEEWELLDEDDKADRVDDLYSKVSKAKKKAKRQKELRASRKFKDDLNQKLRDVRAGLTKEAKKEASRKRKLQPGRMKQKRKPKRKLQ